MQAGFDKIDKPCKILLQNVDENGKLCACALGCALIGVGHTAENKDEDYEKLKELWPELKEPDEIFGNGGELFVGIYRESDREAGKNIPDIIKALKENGL